jgi:hypothetical protein
MAISFQCPQCGKKLKAPESAAGKSSKCPGCGGTVTCPAPGQNEEVVEMALDTSVGGGRDPYGDLEEPLPRGGVGVGAAPAATTRARRPCPACGEMIDASATKCPECGETFFFDPPATKPKKGKGKKAKTRDLARAHKSLIISILVMLVSYVGLLVMGSALRQPAVPGAAPAVSAPAFAIAVVLLIAMGVASFAALVFAVMLSHKVWGTGGAVLMGVLQFIPCVSLIALFVLSKKVTAMLQDKGIEVGFFGADLSQL